MFGTCQYLARVDGSAADGLVSWYLNEEKNVLKPDSEEYKKYRRLYISFFKEAIRRWRLRHLQTQARSAKYRAEKLANAVRAMDCLNKTVDNPKIREKLVYRVNPLYFAR